MSDERFQNELSQGKWRHMGFVVERFNELSKDCGDAYGDACGLIVEAMGIALTAASVRDVPSLFADIRRISELLCVQRGVDDSQQEAVQRALRLLETWILR